MGIRTGLEFKYLHKIDPTWSFKKMDFRETSEFPQFFRCSPEFAIKNSGSYLGNILVKILTEGFKDKQYKYFSVDSRTHMLMPKWYPCIPGWHCDDFYRSKFGQPDLKEIESGIAPMEHIMFILGDCSITEFLNPRELPYFPPSAGDNVYKKYDDFINNNYPQYGTTLIEEGVAFKFGQLDFHRGNPATKSEWRYFLRVSASNHFIPCNEIRTQTQVYISDPSIGW